VSVSADYDGEAGGWMFAGEAGEQKPIRIGEFISGIAAQFSATPTQALPEFIASLEIDHLGVTFDTVTKDFTFNCETRFSIAGTPLDLTFEIVLRNSDGGYTQIYGGALSIGQLRFALFFERVRPGEGGQVSSMFLAAVQPDVRIDLKSLVAGIDAGAGELMPALTIELENALFLYRKTEGVPGSYLFGLALGLDLDLDLASLPLVGPVFSDSKLGGIKEIQALYVSAPAVADDVTMFNGLLTQAQVKPGCR
jgi:hypothetical protein